MKNKKLAIIVTTTMMAMGVIAVTSANSTLFSGVFAEECEHVGNHYAATEATCCEAGNSEFWACCKCLQQFTTNPGGTWTDKELTEAVPSTHVAYVAPTENHQFDENGVCTTSGCTATIASAYGLNAATTADLSPVLSCSTIGLAEGTLPLASAGAHAKGTIDYPTVGNFDLYFKYNASAENMTGDTNILFYLFNGTNGGVDENGIVFRLGTSRGENDGIQSCYVFTTGAVYEGNVVPGAGSAGTAFYMPRVSGMLAAQDNFFHIHAEVTDAATNTYALTFSGGAVGGAEIYVSANPEDKTNTPTVFNVTLGADYFADANSRRLIRISHTDGKISGASVTLSSYYPTDTRDVVYTKADGTPIAKQSYATSTSIAVPTLTKAGQKFVGWFTSTGVRVDDTLVAGKYVVSPRFATAESTNSLTLRDSTQWSAHVDQGNGWYDCGAYANNEHGEHFTNFDSSRTDRIDFYFLFKADVGTGDTYVIFGMPYDFTDENARTYVRFELYTSTISGYFYGRHAGLGNAGDTGTYFNFSNIPFKSGCSYLVHVSVAAVDAATNQYTVAFDVTSMADGATNGVSRSATYDDYAINVENRNMFTVLKESIKTGTNAYIGYAW